MKPRKLTPRYRAWLALSELYLDTELTDRDVGYLVERLRATGFTLAELVRIDEREVAPVLAGNLVSVAGVWSGFRERELIANIEQRLEDVGPLGRVIDVLLRPYRRWLTATQWQRLRVAWAAAAATDKPE